MHELVDTHARIGSRRTENARSKGAGAKYRFQLEKETDRQGHRRRNRVEREKTEIERVEGIMADLDPINLIDSSKSGLKNRG